MPFKNKRNGNAYNKPKRRSGVRYKHGTAPEPATPKPWPDDKPPGGRLEVKRLSDGNLSFKPVKD